MEVYIIGGGLSGLTLSYFLKQRNIQSTILEASSRLGGRIQTIKGSLNTPLELGATWLTDSHHHLLGLMKELGLRKHPQFTQGKSFFQTTANELPQEFYVPAGQSASHRIVDGTQILIDSLAKELNTNDIKLSSKVTSITEEGNKLLIQTSDDNSYEADKVILCLPPQLVASSIQFSPELPPSLKELMTTVQTWMSGSIKFVLEYEQPFWREKGYSGMLYSHIGLIREMYDHTNVEKDKFGFTGFLDPQSTSLSQEVRREKVLSQISKIIGEEALMPTQYFDKVWKDEFVLGNNEIIQRAHQSNGHPLLQQAYFNEKLLLAATETAAAFSGYMEGAIIAAKHTANKL
ncbi:MAG: FAD-dependent oxidoreductase [Cyclobacteriaceae bacterium]|nr:FAD-dependent oxidoreductase [Cyclobacteriaceae bacterium]MCH8517467.1 FAD-dependent oxidoreductase [Cyclobacteriaceae bacterium]